MSTLNEALSKQHRLSIWHVYHKGDEHITITPFINPKKEFGLNKKSHKKLAAEYPQTPDRNNESNSYFVHHPTLLFHNAPRTLRRGNKKTGTPVCLIKCGAFWLNWKIQFGDNLKDVIDPRGVVKWECRSNPNNTTLNDDRALKGYKVRTWRVWGESGKRYHRQVNAQRKENKNTEAMDGDPVEMEKVTEDGKHDLSYSQKQDPSPPSYSAAPQTTIPQPAVAEEAVRLNWSSPFSLNTRRYSFEYANVKFFWKGTRDVHPDKQWTKWLMPFSHLKLIARLPGIEGEDILVGQYTPSFAWRKFGELWIFDSVVAKLLGEVGSPTLTGQGVVDEMRDIRKTRLYELIMATAMCMIIGEAQKREILIALLAMAAEGGSSN
ncbi:hypothetical protein N7519_007877 [Penicillium mononematosum]|uniref:uncharacterized protein n=1 Tax=Penicillium mononematosum TaxID=268346 RepID=UPI00254749BD|nr:uncharacterized protein N7519_007877 [Penicillium mononematosum]KAJ6186576.1 hypothetical protein N7519_007877 [Penicillium mononematosum]